MGDMDSLTINRVIAEALYGYAFPLTVYQWDNHQARTKPCIVYQKATATPDGTWRACWFNPGTGRNIEGWLTPYFDRHWHLIVDAEARLSDEQRRVYVWAIADALGAREWEPRGLYAILTATPAQRAAAMCRVVGGGEHG